MKNTVTILGAGAWGTAIAKAVAEKGFPVRLWSFEAEVAADINGNRRNSRYLPDVPLPGGITADTDIRRAAEGAEFIIIATPSLHILPAVKSILAASNVMEGQSLIGVLSKGFVTTDAGPRLIVAALEDYLPGFYKNNLVYISGPSHAEEVARGKLTGLISASANGKNSIRFRELLSSPTLMVFSSFDVVGVQVCGACKNVVAVAFGMLDALKETSSFVGDNTESLLLAAGLNEIQALGLALGATHPETFTSIAGVGDLDVTCRSRYGRNRRFGRQIILDGILDRFRDMDDLFARLPEIGYLPEGAVAGRAVYHLGRQRGLKLPIMETVHRILNREGQPIPLIEELIATLTKT